MEDAFDPEEDFFIQQYLNIYTEDFIDTDFEGSGTATWGSGSLSFTSGQVGLSTSIDFNNTLINAIKSIDTVSLIIYYFSPFVRKIFFFIVNPVKLLFFQMFKY